MWKNAIHSCGVATVCQREGKTSLCAEARTLVRLRVASLACHYNLFHRSRRSFWLTQYRVSFALLAKVRRPRSPGAILVSGNWDLRPKAWLSISIIGCEIIPWFLDHHRLNFPFGIEVLPKRFPYTCLPPLCFRTLNKRLKWWWDIWTIVKRDVRFYGNIWLGRPNREYEVCINLQLSLTNA